MLHPGKIARSANVQERGDGGDIVGGIQFTGASFSQEFVPWYKIDLSSDANGTNVAVYVSDALVLPTPSSLLDELWGRVTKCASETPTMKSLWAP